MHVGGDVFLCPELRRGCPVLLFGGKSGAYVFEVEVVATGRGELAAEIDLRAVLEVLDEFLVAFVARIGTHVSREGGVLIAELGCVGYLDHTFECDVAQIPSAAFLCQVGGFHILLVVGLLGSGLCTVLRGEALVVVSLVLALELLHGLGWSLDEDEIDAGTYLVAARVGHIAFDIGTYIVGQALVYGNFGDGRKKVHEFIKTVYEGFLVEVSCVDVHSPNECGGWWSLQSSGRCVVLQVMEV